LEQSEQYADLEKNNHAISHDAIYMQPLPIDETEYTEHKIRTGRFKLHLSNNSSNINKNSNKNNKNNDIHINDNKSTNSYSRKDNIIQDTTNSRKVDTTATGHDKRRARKPHQGCDDELVIPPRHTSFQDEPESSEDEYINDDYIESATMGATLARSHKNQRMLEKDQRNRAHGVAFTNTRGEKGKERFMQPKISRPSLVDAELMMDDSDVSEPFVIPTPSSSSCFPVIEPLVMQWFN
jgi:hypothetical protein